MWLGQSELGTRHTKTFRIKRLNLSRVVIEETPHFVGAILSAWKASEFDLSSRFSQNLWRTHYDALLATHTHTTSYMRMSTFLLTTLCRFVGFKRRQLTRVAPKAAKSHFQFRSNVRHMDELIEQKRTSNRAYTGIQTNFEKGLMARDI